MPWCYPSKRDQCGQLNTILSGSVYSPDLTVFTGIEPAPTSWTLFKGHWVEGSEGSHVTQVCPGISWALNSRVHGKHFLHFMSFNSQKDPIGYRLYSLFGEKKITAVFTKIYLLVLFIFGCTKSSLLLVDFLSSCSEWGCHSVVVVHGLLIAVASLLAKHGL